MKTKYKIKHKIISILVIIITIINISGISNASLAKEELETKEIQETKETQKILESVELEKDVVAKEVEKQYITEEEGTKNVSTNLTQEEVIEEANVEILNQDKETNEPIQGNIFAILNQDDTIFKENLQTNQEGKANFTLPIGKYYLQQTSTIEGYNLNKTLIEIDTSNVKNITIKIESTKPTTEENTVVNKEINIAEENKNIIENNIKNVTDYKITNINKEIINETNKTNLHNVNNFINTINRENIANITKENFYRNNIDEDLYTTVMRALGDNLSFSKKREDFANYIDMIMMNSTRVPLLPVASKPNI